VDTVNDTGLPQACGGACRSRDPPHTSIAGEVFCLLAISSNRVPLNDGMSAVARRGDPKLITSSMHSDARLRAAMRAATAPTE